MAQSIEKQLPKLLTVTEVAEWLQVTKDWVYAHSSGKRHSILSSVKLGRNIRFRPEALEKALDDWARS